MHYSWYPVPQRRRLISVDSVDFYCWPECRDYTAHSDDLTVYFQPLQYCMKKGKQLCEISANYLDITHGCVCDFHFFFLPLTSQKSKRPPGVVHLDIDLMKKCTALENTVTKQKTTACKCIPVTQCRHSQLLLRSSRNVSLLQVCINKRSINWQCHTLPLWRLLPCNPCSWKASTLPCKQTEKQQQQQVVRD